MAAPFTPHPDQPDQPDRESVTGDATPAGDADAMATRIPVPPPGITTRQHRKLEEIARQAADVIAAARADGLTVPYGLRCHDYGPPHCTLSLSSTDAPNSDIWGALDDWARRFGTIIDTRLGSTPDIVHAEAGFVSDGVRYEVSAVINTTDSPGDRPPDASQAP
jgi:hypothetical protein